jgi:hypothetical protein
MPTVYPIIKGNQYFDVSLWAGTGASNTIVNSGGMPPALLWQKRRSGEQNNWLTDIVRGNTKIITSNTTQVEGTVTDCVTSFNSNGFTLGVNDAFNGVGNTNVMWQWRGGSTTVTNTSGSITSSVSANTTSGFSVVTWTGTGSAATVGHGLSAAPRIIFVKRRDAISNWAVYNQNLGNTNFMQLNTTVNSTAQGANNFWNSTSPTSTVFSVGTVTDINASGGTYVAYCWAEVPGFSKMGSYTGNGNADGPFVYTGFRPEYVLIRNSSITQNWNIYDVARSPSNVAQSTLATNTASGEFTDAVVNLDILSNGFKIRTTDSGSNGSGNTIIYMAFAEMPTKYANAR